MSSNTTKRTPRRTRPTPAQAQMAPAGRITEEQLQASVLELARYAGYLAYHPYDSRRSEYGYPDLTLVHPHIGRVIFAELKSERGRVRPEQQVWLEALGRCPGVECYVWRPSDWREGRIEAILLAPLALVSVPQRKGAA